MRNKHVKPFAGVVVVVSMIISDGMSLALTAENNTQSGNSDVMQSQQNTHAYAMEGTCESGTAELANMWTLQLEEIITVVKNV